MTRKNLNVDFFSNIDEMNNKPNISIDVSFSTFISLIPITIYTKITRKRKTNSKQELNVTVAVPEKVIKFNIILNT